MIRYAVAFVAAAFVFAQSASALEMTAVNATRNADVGLAMRLDSTQAAVQAAFNDFVERNAVCANKFSFYSPKNAAADTDGCITPETKTVPAGIVASFNGTTCPSGWAELTAARNRFIIGAGGSYSRGAVGGALTATLAQENLPHVSLPIYAYKYVGADDAAAGNNASSIRFLASGRNTRSSSANGGLGANIYSRTDYLGDGTPFSIAPPYLALLQCYKL